MYKLPKEVFDILLNKSSDPLTGERIIGYLCGKTQEIYEGMEYVLQRFLPGEQGPSDEYWLYKMEEFFAGEENEVVFQPEFGGEELEKKEIPEERGIETIVVQSLSELLEKEPGLCKYISLNEILN